MKKSKKAQNAVFSEKDLQEDLARSAKAVGIPTNTAVIIAEKITPKVADRMSKRAIVTTDDYNNFIAEEAEKYNKDLAYIYKNRDKII